MKRKLSALLAIVLAVVMVFPTAVFVGADSPDKITITDGSIAIVESQTIEIPLGVSKVLNYSAPTGYSVTCNKDLSGSATSALVESGKVTFTGTAVNDKADVYTFKATKNDSPDLTFTLKVKCIPITISDITVYGKSDESLSHKTEAALTGSETYKTGNVLDLTKIDITYDYKKDGKDAKDLSVSLSVQSSI